MSRPPLPPARWDLNRELDRPEDAVFGLTDDGFELDEQDGGRFGSAQKAAQKAVDVIEGLMGGLKRRKDKEDRDDELQELMGLQQAHDHGGPGPARYAGPAAAGSLDDHIIRLDGSRWQEFIEAERRTSLFEQYETARTQNMRYGALGLWVASALLMFLAYKGGQGYVLGLLADDVQVPAQLLELAKDQDVARGVVFVAGMFAPLLAFVLCAFAAGEFLQGVGTRSAAKLVTGLAGLTGVLMTVAFLVAGAYLPAVAVPVGFRVLIRMLGRAMDRAGVR